MEMAGRSLASAQPSVIPQSYGIGRRDYAPEVVEGSAAMWFVRLKATVLLTTGCLPGPENYKCESFPFRQGNSTGRVLTLTLPDETQKDPGHTEANGGQAA